MKDQNEPRSQIIKPAPVEATTGSGRAILSNAQELAEIYFVKIESDPWFITIETGYISAYQQKLFELIFNSMVKECFELPEGGVFTHGGRCSVTLSIPVGDDPKYWDNEAIPIEQRRTKWFAQNINRIIDWTGNTKRKPPEAEPIDYSEILDKVANFGRELFGKTPPKLDK